MKTRRIICVILAVLFALTLASCGNDGNTDTDEAGTTEAPVTEPGTLVDGIMASDVFAYTGAYFEDGSDENVENCAAVYITNTSERYIRYAGIAVNTAGHSFAFEFTTLFPGETVMVLDKNRSVCYGEYENTGFTVNDEIDFAEAPSLYGDRFTIIADGTNMSLVNNTDKSYDDVYVYYKIADGKNSYRGGITYRVNFDTVNAGETKTQSSAHLSENSAMMFITFGQEG